MFKKAYRHNWDNGLKTLFEIIRDKDCDKGTALMIFWHGSPNYFYNKVSFEELESYNKPNYELLKEIEQKVQDSAFETLISYAIEEMFLLDEYGSIPEALRGPVKGKIEYEDILWPNNNPFQEEVLAICQSCDSIEEFYALEQKGADFNKKIINGYSYPIEVAINHGQVEALKYFIAREFDLNKKYNKTPLLFNAVNSKNIELVKLMIENGSNVNKKGEFGRTVLHNIAGMGDYDGGFDSQMEEIANYLLAQGADPGKTDVDKKTPLDLAEMWENKAFVDFLS